MPMWFYADGTRTVTITNTDNGTTPGLTFTLAIGTSGIVAVGIVSGANNITAVTMGGVAMNLQAGSVTRAMIATLPATGASSATFVITCATNCIISAYQIVNASSETPTSTNTTNTLSTTVTVPAHGVAIGAVGTNNSASGATWSGLATKDTDVSIAGAEASTAHDSFATAQSPLTITVTASGGIARLTAAAWGP